MSKIGRMPINIDGVAIDLKGQNVHYNGKNSSGVHELPSFIKVEVKDNNLSLSLTDDDHQNYKFWGLHRALLANKIYGAVKDFERKLIIKGLGYKALLSGKKITLSLGFSHKIEVTLPNSVSLEVDKSGQNLTFKSYDKQLLGQTCDKIRSFRPPEPYKGTGVRFADEIVRRKAGKAKSA